MNKEISIYIYEIRKSIICISPQAHSQKPPTIALSAGDLWTYVIWDPPSNISFFFN